MAGLGHISRPSEPELLSFAGTGEQLHERIKELESGWRMLAWLRTRVILGVGADWPDAGVTTV